MAGYSLQKKKKGGGGNCNLKMEDLLQSRLKTRVVISIFKLCKVHTVPLDTPKIH